MITRITLIAMLLTLLADFVLAQNRAIRPYPNRGLITTRSDSFANATRIITKVPFQGTNYFILIVPIDSQEVDKMPIYNPNRPGTIYWNDSLQRMLPDKILRQLPKGPTFK